MKYRNHWISGPTSENPQSWTATRIQARKKKSVGLKLRQILMKCLKDFTRSCPPQALESRHVGKVPRGHTKRYQTRPPQATSWKVEGLKVLPKCSKMILASVWISSAQNVSEYTVVLGGFCPVCSKAGKCQDWWQVYSSEFLTYSLCFEFCLDRSCGKHLQTYTGPRLVSMRLLELPLSVPGICHLQVSQTQRGDTRFSSKWHTFSLQAGCLQQQPFAKYRINTTISITIFCTLNAVIYGWLWMGWLWLIYDKCLAAYLNAVWQWERWESLRDHVLYKRRRKVQVLCHRPTACSISIRLSMWHIFPSLTLIHVASKLDDLHLSR